MAEFTSQYKSLGFYHKGRVITFTNGVYVTNDAEEIAVLSALRDVTKTQEQAKQPEAEKPAPTKAPATRKASAK